MIRRPLDRAAPLALALVATPLAAQQAPAPGEGEAGVTTARPPVRLELSGRVSPAVLYADGGDGRTKAFVVDNDNSGSRFGLAAETTLRDWTAGAVLVIGVEVNSTDEVGFDDGPQASERFGEGDVGEVRQAHAYAEHPRFGRLSLGQGDEAGEGASEADLSGTAPVAQSDVDDTAGGLRFALADGGDDRVDDVFSNLDADRSMRLLYETPGFGGIVARVSLTQSDELEPALALLWDAEPAGWRIRAALAWRRPDGGDEPEGDVVHGSVSALAPSGTSATLAAGAFSRDGDGADDPRFVYAKLGHTLGGLVPGGPTSVSVDGFAGRRADAFAGPDGALPRATSIGAGVVQAIDALSAELYLGVRRYALRDVHVDGAPVDDPEDILAVLAGGRIRF